MVDQPVQKLFGLIKTAWFHVLCQHTFTYIQHDHHIHALTRYILCTTPCAQVSQSGNEEKYSDADQNKFQKKVSSRKRFYHLCHQHRIPDPVSKFFLPADQPVIQEGEQWNQDQSYK